MPLDNPKDDALHEAAKNGDLARIEQLLKTGYDINQPHSIHSTTPLCWAAQQGKTDAVKLLLGKGALLNSTAALDKGSLNALQYALESKNDATIEVLVNATQKYLETNKKNFSSLAAASCLDLLSYAATLIGYYSKSEEQTVLFGQYFDNTVSMLEQLQKKSHEVVEEDFCFFYAKLGSFYLTITNLQKPLSKDPTENLTYAFAAFQKAENATQQIPDKKLKIRFAREFADNFCILGNAFLKTKNFQQAMNCYNSSIEMNLKGKKLPLRSVRLSLCYSHLGIAQLHLQQLKNASDSFDQVQQCLNNIKNPDSKLPNIQAIANEIKLSGTKFLTSQNYEPAIFCFEQVMRFYSTEMANPALADIDCINLSAACFGLRKAQLLSKPTNLIDFANISQFLEKITDITLKVNYAIEISQDANALGTEFFKKDNFEQAVRCYKFAIDTCAKDNASSYRSLIVFYRNLGISQVNLRKFEDALASYLESSRYLTQIQDQDANVEKITDAFNKLGNIFYRSKSFQCANTCYEQVATFVSSQKDQKDINLSAAYGNLGNTQILLGQSEAAVASYQKSCNYLTNVPDEIDKANKARQQSKILENFSPNFLSEGEFERVNICLRHSINFLQIITNPTRTDCAELSLLYSYLPQYPLYNSEYCSTLASLFSSQGSSKDILTLLFKVSHDELKSQQLHKHLICQALKYLLKVYNKEGFLNKFLKDDLANEEKKLKLETALSQFETTFPSLQDITEENAASMVAMIKMIEYLNNEVKNLTQKVQGEKESQSESLQVKPLENEATQPPITKFFNPISNKRKSEQEKNEDVVAKKVKTADEQQESESFKQS